MNDNEIIYHDCMPMMADVISGSVPRPVEWTTGNIYDWMRATPACRRLAMQDAVLIAAYSLGAVERLTGFVAQLREHAGEPGSVWKLGNVYICLNIDGTRATVYTPHTPGTSPDTSLALGEDRKQWLRDQGGIQPTIIRLIDEAMAE